MPLNLYDTIHYKVIGLITQKYVVGNYLMGLGLKIKIMSLMTKDYILAKSSDLGFNIGLEMAVFCGSLNEKYPAQSQTLEYLVPEGAFGQLR